MYITKHLTVDVLPVVSDPDTIYTLTPILRNASFYDERTDRNRGWITRNEQLMLRHAVVGIAGCGGMGGLLASILVRLGVGEIRIADSETFEVSNLNRQFAATLETLGESKALATARMMRAIADDTTVTAYPQGITSSTVKSFLSGCDIVADEIEFWAVGARILLHQHARKLKVPLTNCSTVGWSSRLFLFDHTGMNIETMLDMELTEAYELQECIQSKSASSEEIARVQNSMLHALIPRIPEYGMPGGSFQSRAEFIARLKDEQCASIIATNPAFASGFIANHVLAYLLEKVNDIRLKVRIPKTPGYLYIDGIQMICNSVDRTEVSDND